MLRSFPAYLAERYLKTRKKGAFVRVMVRFAQVGVAVGVFAMLVTTALMNGWSQELQTTLWSASAHFVVQSQWGDLPNTAETLARIRQVPGVVAATPMRQEYALVRSNMPGAPNGPLLALGVEPSTVHGTTSIFDSLKPIPIEKLQEGEIVLGVEAAERYGLKVGGEAVLTFTRETLSLAGSVPTTAVFKVVGLFHCRISEYDRGWCYLHLNDLNRIAETENAGYIGVRAKDIPKIDEVKTRILLALGQKDQKGLYQLPDLRESNRMMFSALKVLKWVYTAIFSLILLVAMFNIVASLVLLITEKRRDVGVLLSLGCTPAQIQRSFELQGLRIAAMGTAWGLGIGIPFCLICDHFKLIQLPTSVIDFITYLPVRMAFFDLMVVILFPLAVAWVASRYPARRAASVDPVDALRAE